MSMLLRLRALTPIALALLLLASPTATRAAIEPVFETSSMEALWPLVEVLQQDLEPPLEMWDALLETPAYRHLAEFGMSPTYFQRMIQLAVRPGLWQQRDRGLREPELGPVLQHFVEAIERRDAVERAVERLVREGIDDAYLEDVRSLLPSPLPAERPTIAIALWANGGRGGDPLVIDPLAAASWDVGSYLAHELHHWYRDRELDYDREGMNGPDAMLVRWLEVVHAEGVADLVDKDAWVEDPSKVEPARREYMDQYLVHLVETDEAVRALDAALRAWATAEDDAARAAVTQGLDQRIPLGGHPLGYRMARTIRDQLGAGRIASTVGDPFAFALAYDEAARKAGDLASFSEVGREALRALRERYVDTDGK